MLHRYRDFKRSLQQVHDGIATDAAKKAAESLILVCSVDILILTINVVSESNAELGVRFIAITLSNNYSILLLLFPLAAYGYVGIRLLTESGSFTLIPVLQQYRNQSETP